MRKIDWLHHTSPRQFLEHLHEIDLIKQPFSDSEILDIQEKFLSNGFQYIKVPNVVQGRYMVATFLHSMGLYHDTVCLTSHNALLPYNTTDIFKELQVGGYLSTFETHYLDEYFIEKFYFDFMWIEATRAALMSNWFEEIKKQLMNYAIDQQIPIITVVYEEE